MALERESHHLSELTKGMVAGEDGAWQQFHREYGPLIFRQLLGFSHGNPHLAQEALQHVYLRVARHVRISDNEVSWRSWLRTVSRSAISDTNRGYFRFWNLLRRRGDDPTDTIAPEQTEESWLEKVDPALAALNLADRNLLEEKYFADRSVNAIAKDLGITSKALESRLTRARAHLRELLTSHSISPPV